eukprot:jgi/Picre1/33952/NNA_001430.t1
MEQEDEVFDIVDESNTVVRQEYRGVVHRTGLLHRAVYCWVYDTQGRLLLQKRSPLKKIGPNQWDLSLAEHLQPGESYREAVVRGLKEELGISLQDASNSGAVLVGPIAQTHKRELHEGGFHDVELVQSFRLEGFHDASSLKFDDGEVIDVQWIDPGSLQTLIQECPQNYTAWLQAEAAYLNWKP